MMRGEKSKDPGACRKWHAAIFLFCEDAGVRPGTDNSGGGAAQGSDTSPPDDLTFCRGDMRQERGKKGARSEERE